MSEHDLHSYTLPANAGSNEDQVPQCWKDVEAETGFSSYQSFLEACAGPHFSGLLEDLRDDGVFGRFQHQPYFGEIFVLDILKDGSTSISLEARKSAEFAILFDSDREASTRLLQNLRSPPENVPARILLWSMLQGNEPSSGIIDALGLGLDVHPFFFESLCQIMSPIRSPRKPCRSDHFIIGDTVVAVARKYRPEGRAPPVLLIAGKFGLHDRLYDGQQDYQQSSLVKETFEEEIVESPSHYRGTINRRPPDTLASVSSNYVELLRKQALQGCGLILEEDTVLLNAILPLLYLEILRLRIHCRNIRTTLLQLRLKTGERRLYSADLLQHAYDSAEDDRFWLRRRLEDLDESKTHIIKFVRSQDGAEWLKDKTWSSQDEDIREAIAEARTCDAEVRDYIQIQIGNLSIQESRKSIQLSNQQIDEAKRGKDI